MGAGRCEAPRIDPLIVFIHVPKTAGSMVNHRLSAIGMKGHPHIEDCIDQPEVLTEKAAYLDWVSGHVTFEKMKSSLSRVTTRPLRFFSAVRDPVSQIRSHYNWLIEIQHRGSAFFEGHPDHIKDISYAISRTDSSRPAPVIARLQEYAGLFLNQQCRVVTSKDVSRLDHGALDVASAEYAFIAFEETLERLLFKMTETEIAIQEKVNESPYHFDPAIFETPEIRDFLAERHSGDFALYEHVKRQNFHSVKHR